MFFKITVVLRQDDSHITAFLIFRIKARTSNGKTIGCVESHVSVVQNQPKLWFNQQTWGFNCFNQLKLDFNHENMGILVDITDKWWLVDD